MIDCCCAGQVTLCIYGDMGKSQEIPLRLEDIEQPPEEKGKKAKKGKKDEGLFAAGQTNTFMVLILFDFIQS